MSKLTNIVKKGMLFHILVAFVIAAALVIGGVFGFNSATELTDTNTLTVTINSFTYNNDLDAVEEECEKAFEAEGLKVAYKMNGEMSGDDCELLYVFAEGVNLDNAKAVLEKSFAEKTADGGALAGSFISVSTSAEAAKAVVAKGYAVRGAVAIVVFAALAFAYMTIRYRWDMGVVTAISVALGSVLTAAIVALVRIPVTTSLLYVVAIGGLMSAVTTLMTLAKARANSEDDCIAVKEICLLCATAAVAIVVLGVAGAIANISLLWFAVLALVAVAVSAFIGLIYAPVVYLPLKSAADSKDAEKATGYQGAKKTSTKVKKTFVKEVKEEAPVAAEVVEETETVEEAEEATEETAEVAEETVGETAEEATEEVETAEEATEETTEDAAEESAE